MRSLVSSLTIFLLACSPGPSILADDKDSAPHRTTTPQDIRRLEERLLENYTGTKKKKKKNNTPKLDIPNDENVFSSSVPISPINLDSLSETRESVPRDIDEEENDSGNWILPPRPDFGDNGGFEPFVPYGQDLMEQLERMEGLEPAHDSSREESESEDSPSGLPADINQMMQEYQASRSEYSTYREQDSPTDEELFFEEMLEEEDEESEQASQNVFPESEFGYLPVIDSSTFEDEESADSGEPNSDFLRSEADEEAYHESMVKDSYQLSPTEGEYEESQERSYFAFADSSESDDENEPDMTLPFWRTQEAIRSILYKESPDLSSTESEIGSFETWSESASTQNQPFRSASSIIQSIRDQVTGEMNQYNAGEIQPGSMGAESTAMGVDASSNLGAIQPAVGSVSEMTGRSLDLNPGFFGGASQNAFGGSRQISTQPIGSSFGSSGAFGSRYQFDQTTTSPQMNRKRQGLDARTVETLMK
jgi:hypothetical protein